MCRGAVRVQATYLHTSTLDNRQVPEMRLVMSARTQQVPMTSKRGRLSRPDGTEAVMDNNRGGKNVKEVSNGTTVEPPYPHKDFFTTFLGTNKTQCPGFMS